MEIEVAREVKARLRHEVTSLVAEQAEPDGPAAVAVGVGTDVDGAYTVAIRHSGQPRLAETVAAVLLHYHAAE